MKCDCILCGQVLGTVADNRDYVVQSWQTFAMRIPTAETAVCHQCDLAWVRIDGVLTSIGKPYRTAQQVRIPDGTLAVFGERHE